MNITATASHRPVARAGLSPRHWCHAQTGASSERGRLVVTALGDGQFRFAVIKRAARESADHDFCPRGQNVQPDQLLSGMPSLHTALHTWAMQERRSDPPLEQAKPDAFR